MFSPPSWHKEHPVLKLYEVKSKKLHPVHFLNALYFPFCLGLVVIAIQLIYTYRYSLNGFVAALSYKKSTPPLVLGTQITPPAPTALPLPSTTPKPTPSFHTVFRLSLRPQSSFQKPDVSFLRFISETFSASGLSLSYSGPYYAITQGNPYEPMGYGLYNFDYYLIKTAGSSLTPRKFEREGVTLLVDYDDEAIKPYLYDHRYCQIDTDCVTRESYCIVGAFNRYEPILNAWFCPQGKITQEGVVLGNVSVPHGCPLKVRYDKTVCVKHTCTGINPNTYCE